MNWKKAIHTKLKKLTEFRQLGLVTDMDGTISPIVDNPAEAHVTEQNRVHLQALSEVLPLVAILSGRSVTDISCRVGLTDIVYIGNHGLETMVGNKVEVLPEAQSFRPNLRKAIQILNPMLAPGMTIEDKGITCSIHYRRTNDPESVKERMTSVVENIAKQNGLRFFHGRKVFELRPPVNVDKGYAFRNLVNQYSLEAAIFLGDDITDIAALEAASQLRREGKCYALGLGVFSTGAPLALRTASDIFASGVRDVETFLGWLLNACRASST